MSSIANDASSLPSRTHKAFRGAQPKADIPTGAQDPGGFAALMDCRSDPAPAPAPKPAPKADRPAPRDDGNDQTATPASQPDASQTSDAVAALESPPAEAKAGQSGQTAEETVQPVEAPKPATDANADPAVAVVAVAVAVVDPNAVAVPVMVVPTAPVPANGEAPAENAAQPVTMDGATAPVLPIADQNAGQPRKVAGKQAPQVQAPTQDADGSAEDAAADQTAPADQPQEPQKHVKPQVPQQQAEKAPQDAVGDKQQPKHATDPDSAAPAAKTASEPAAHVATPAPVATTHAAAAPAANLQAAPVILTQPVPVNALAVEIAGQARAGNSRFEIRLDPPELGRIDVRLDVDRDGNVTSRLVIDRADTYDLLRRDQSTLERALQQAGLKTSDNALEFSLRDQGFANQQQQDDTPARKTTALIADADTNLTDAASGYARLLRSGGGIDIRV